MKDPTVARRRGEKERREERGKGGILSFTIRMHLFQDVGDECSDEFAVERHDRGFNGTGTLREVADGRKGYPRSFQIYTRSKMM
jgi:hypothetical protein